MLRLYRALLGLYPGGFVADYESELCAVFAQRMCEHTGPLAPLRIAWAAISDVVPNALAAHRDMLRQDLHFAVRSLRRAPGFALTVVVLVALGVGANAAAFSLADFVLVRPLPYPAPEQLVKVWQRTPDGGTNELSPAIYRDWSAASTPWFAGFGAYIYREANLVGVAEPRRLQLARVTTNVMPLVGVPTLVGRTIVPGDSAEPGVVVISYALWQTQFGGASDVVGKVVRLDGAPHTVIGVMPPTYRFPRPRVDAWTPLVPRGDDFADRGDTYYEGIARLRPGVSFERARDAMIAVTARIEAPFVAENGDSRAAVLRVQDEISRRARLLLLSLCGAALCILLLACANLAGLLLARAGHRARELAVRAALGGARERLVRQLVTENVALAAVGALLGVALAAAGVPLLGHLIPSGLPLDEHPTVDARVLGIALAVVAVTCLLFGVMPGVRTSGRGMFEALRDGGRAGGGRTQRLRAALVVVEVAASVVLLVSSGLLVRAVLRVESIDPGFRPESVLTVRTALPWPKYMSTTRREQFYDRVLRDVRALPGVTAAGYSSGLPMRFTGGIWRVPLTPGAADAKDVLRTSMRLVTPHLFGALGVPLRRGRDVAESDVRGTVPVAVVSESFARRMWPGADPLGRRFTIDDVARTVVGVVGDVRVRGRERVSEPQVYLPDAQVADGGLQGYSPADLVVRSTAPSSALLPSIRAAVRAADAEQPIADVMSLGDLVDAETAPRVTQIRLLAALSALALLIAGVGIHGLLAYTVSRRTRELAVRRALGAGATGVVRMVIGEGLALAAAGVVIGVALAYPTARGMRALLAGVEPADPLTLGGVAALCVIVTVLGCLRPAVSAARVAPLSALRGD